MAILEVDRLSHRFGGLLVVDDLTFAVGEGEIVGLIGPNGAGKTTVLNLITGLYSPDQGDIRFEGESVAGLAPHEVTERGIARTFQTLRLFLNMTVIDNVMSAAYCRTGANLAQIILRTPAFRREEAATRQRAEELLAFFGERITGYRFGEPAYSLSYANRRRLEIARALMCSPRLLLLDEPAAGMNPSETSEVTELIGRLRTEGGYTILFIEHDMGVVADIADRVIALDHGRMIAEGSYEEVVANPSVIEAYLGHSTGTTR
jgi:branched-chain amino acid transport system ATP-binding protein